ncbi:MAG: DUF6519 domain-containing protein [Gammaproteobacteria bacterium]|nr:DUF6519 domain-containing protein [Gammaproteobacteria bacterium]
MKIQKSRNSRQPVKDYSSVCHQQGRMLTDSDLTEQALLSRDRLNQALKDVIGSGTPRHGALLQVTESGDERIPSLHWGRVYVDGVLGEVRADADAPDADLFDYNHQRYSPEAPALPESAAHRLYVDVWERSVIWLEDEMLRDPGLHGADTTTRTQTTAQVKWCDGLLDPLCPDINPTLGDARLRLVLRSLATSADPCDPCADELELNDPVGNYLFRVEVHDVSYDGSDQPEALVLKWSSENGAEAYATADVPPDFASNQFVYEFFDEVSEKRLGVHLGRDGSGQRIIDGQRPGLVNEFSDTSASARDFVRRWDGWCRIEKSGSDWQLTEGFEGSIDLTSGVGADKPGHVIQGGDAVGIELRVISLEIELADHPLVAGDFWTVPVRESIHQQGEVLLEDEDGDGVPPEGEPHHYMLLVDVAADGTLSLPPASGCDGYNACQLPQFPSLTDLRAKDICFDNNTCEMPEVGTVQEALDHLCQERDLRWHNKHLHGWGVVCGLILECDPEDPASVVLNTGYALDCEGNDMVVEDDVSINILKRLEEEQIDPATLEDDQGLCLYLEYTPEGQLDLGIELYDPEDQDLVERLRDTLLFDFYEHCILDLIKAFTGELQETDVQARCAITQCGRQEIRPVQRRTLTLTNLLFQYQQGESNTVLNISQCEHALLEDLYDRLRNLLRSKTFCAQFQNQDFPDYPFDGKPCRATWFTPQPLDHIRLHPDGKLAFAWRRSSNRVFVFEQLKAGCLGDLVGYFDVPQLDNGSITDLTIDRDNLIHLSGIVHEEDTLFARGKLPEISREECELKIEWQTSFMCGVKVVVLRQSPWSTQQLYAVGLCKGAYLIDPEALFKEDKIEREPDWAFPASGHLDFDVNGTRVICTAAEKSGCEKGQYDRLVFFKPVLDADVNSQPVSMLVPIVNDQPVIGSDGFVVAQSSAGERDDVRGDNAAAEIVISNLNRNLLLFLVADIGDSKVLCRFDAAVLQKLDGQQWPGDFYHSFGAASHIALKYVRGGKLDGVVATRYAMHDMQYIPGDPRQYQKTLLTSIPVQAGPVDIATHDELQQLHVLNHMGQSITVLNYALPEYQEQRPTLQEYRADVLAAFYQLLSGLLQYLKDCFCQHLLVKCPECDEDDKVYLGCLSLRDNEVYNICNFTKRKTVKTLDAFAYWLSLIPIGPIVAWAIERLCCLVLPNLFEQRETQAFAISPQQLGTVSAVMNTDHNNMLQAVSLASKDVTKKGLNELVRAGYQDNSSYQDLVGTEYHYKPGVIQTVQPAFTTNQAIKDKVDSIEIDRAKTKDEVATLQNEVNTLRQEKLAAEERFQALEADYNNVLVKRVEAVEVDKQQAEQEVTALKAEIAVLKEEKTSADQRFTKLEQDIVELNKLRTHVEPIVRAAEPVATIEGISPENARILEANNITTVKQLADANVDRLKELGIRHNTATSLIKKANDKLVIAR